MQHSRLLCASVCISALLFAAPAFAFSESHHGGGHGSGGGFHGSYAAGGWHGGGAWHGGGWHGAVWHTGAVYPLYAYGYGYPYGYDYDYPGYWFNGDYGNYGYDTPAYDYSYGVSYGYGPDIYAQGSGQNSGAYAPYASAQFGQYCHTPVKSCLLHSPGTLGASCSCRGGSANRIYGQVGQ